MSACQQVVKVLGDINYGFVYELHNLNFLIYKRTKEATVWTENTDDFQH